MKIKNISLKKVAGGLVALGIIGYLVIGFIIIPFISPDPIINTFPATCPKPNNCTRVADTNNREPDVQPPVLSANASQVKQAIIQWMGDQVILNQTATFMHIKWTQPITRFIDDVLILLKPNGTTQTTVWIQSQSRLGEWDFNTNTNRVNSLLSFLVDFTF